MAGKVVDMGGVQKLLDECQDLADDLDGQPVEDAKIGGRNKEVARTNRRLLYLADQLTAASAQVRQQYWQGRDK